MNNLQGQNINYKNYAGALQAHLNKFALRGETDCQKSTAIFTFNCIAEADEELPGNLMTNI